MDMKREEVLVFITFFIIFSFFVQWNDAWDHSLFLSPARSVVEKNSLDINPYVNSTHVRLNKTGNYYSPRHLGHSFFATPVYHLSTGLYSFLPERYSPQELSISYMVEPLLSMNYEQSGKLSFARFGVTFFLVALTGSLTILLFYKILRFLTSDSKVVVLLTFGLGFGTSIFTYSTTFYPYIPATLLSLLSFYLLIKTKESGSSRYFLLSGVLMGFAIGTFELAFIPATLFFIYSFKIKRIGCLFFLVGALSGFLPYIIYNFLILETAFTLPAIGNIFPIIEGLPLAPERPAFEYEHMGTVGEIIGPEDPNPFNVPAFLPEAITRTLFYPYRGLFFFYPFLLLFFPGIYFMYKNSMEVESFLLLAIFMFSLLAVVFHGYWWGHFAFGPRRLVLLIPFITIPIIYCFKGIRDHRYEKTFKFAIVSLIIVSISINFLGLQVWEGEPDIDPEEAMGTLRPLGNPLVERYSSFFLENGPRSMLLENLLINNEINIWNAGHACKSYEYVERTEIPLYPSDRLGIITLRIPFLALFLVLLIVFLIWHGYVASYLGIPRMKLLIIALLAASVIFTLGFVRIRLSLATRGWEVNGWGGHRSNEMDIIRRMSQDGTILIHSDREAEKELYFETFSFHQERNLQVFVNGKLVETYTVPLDERKYIHQDIELAEGVNEIRFYSVEGCDRKPEDCNLYCLSVEIYDMDFNPRS